MVKDNWDIKVHGHPMFVLWRKLKRLQPILRGLNRRVTKEVKLLQDYRMKLAQTQQRLVTDPFNDERMQETKVLTDKIILATEEEEKLLMQRAKSTWIKLGDTNNAYFHAIVKKRQKQNRIMQHVDQSGYIVTKQKVMEKEVIQFYEKLIGTSSTNLLHVNINVLRKGARLKEDSKKALILPITKKEIWAAFTSIGDTKTPGFDGFTARFFKSAWDIVKQDLLLFVQEIYTHHKLYFAVNCAVVTLIPKTPNANSMRELKPIACCTTLYKILSKFSRSD